jgi:trans-2,3-dihydro-3-hydroxyanthranilate isomerase
VTARVALQYLHYDVFTSEALAGNQLAVFLDGRGLDTRAMQRIAREMNFSESTFILPAEREGTDVRMRIFTPQVEMPMAGHPTIGSTFALARSGVIAPGRRRFVFELNVGAVPVDLEWVHDDLSFAWMTQGVPVFGRHAERALVAEALGLTLDEVMAPVQEVSCGVPYWIVPLRDRDSVDRAVADASKLRRLGEQVGVSIPLYLFADDDPRPEPLLLTPQVRCYCRMFAPGVGVLEDPATGSAAGPLGCYLVRHRLVPDAPAQRITIEQGVLMGRRSRMHVAIHGGPDVISTVQVGGEAVLVGRGELYP